MQPFTTFTLSLAILTSVSLAERIAPLALPPSAFTDTEASTNIAITAWNVSRSFSVSLTLDASASNCVEVAYRYLALLGVLVGA